MGAEARWQSRLADWQSREQTAESRSDRMVNRGEPLRRSQIAVQAGKQASRQPASMSQRQRQRQSQSQKPGLRMNLAAAAVL